MKSQVFQTRADRETLYPPDNQLCSSPQHFAAASMNPFLPMRNIDGLSNKYTDNLYEYAARPFCTQALPNCGSKWVPFALSGQVVTPTPPPLVTSAPIIVAPQETCFNENQCCAPWAASGECTRNVGYMSEWCKASCGHCRPQYRLVDDCSDRHPNCLGWSRQGECTKNVLWMTENCRKSCGKCSQSRTQACGGGGAVATTTAVPQPQCDNSEGCFNENVCCPHWSLFGECRKSPTYMACNCRVSCGHCIPTEYSYGSCVDYHRSCAGWARQGECEKNPWMAENCRASCRTCYSQWDLRSMCRGAVGSVRPVATNRQQTNVVQTPQWQQGGWNNGFEDDWGGMGWGNGGGGRGNGWGGQTSNWGGPPPNWAQPQWWLRRAKRD
ncbi:unnamed protein product [Heligmosomoides polygyrus]|uniref:ShKT domain-containing protein n=1 Tax=Heligmosomoides polygyrus TaxID=6339 RepID=A0A183G4E7_HELPZ|nr:unnamed protein product [Heligmosomoides polygyrus]